MFTANGCRICADFSPIPDKTTVMTQSQHDTDLFADIRPYHDDEVPAALKRLMADDELLAAIAHFRFPSLSRWFGWLLKPLVRSALQRRWSKVGSVRDVQMEVAHFMERMIASTTDGVTYSGLVQLDSEKG